MEIERITLKVGGTTCEHCAGSIQQALLSVAGVRKVTVNRDRGTAVVECAAGAVQAIGLIGALQARGYAASQAA